ncbi:Copper resistance protein C [Frondihabitans sp. 762G35]|uniref:copper resistance CopC family protein n=1 Tax=Frondihabitans sp. 762G35 TaxID=1446794 RepID=UPI000D2090CA|nr:copper resistance CopC family protein [Frondihabitans sp. 762G35]ARC58186.1 Copper resistance protein C [Frondihabitans sp. 762G35]
MARTIRAGRLRSVAVGTGLLVLAGALALLPATGASAHDYLVSSTPAADSTQTTALSKVVLTFDDRVLDLSGDGSSNVVIVTDAAGKHFETACSTIADTDVSVPVALGDSGRYTVQWQIVSADGHTVANSIRFRYDRPQSAPVATGAATRPTCGDQAPAASSAPVAVPSASASAGAASEAPAVTSTLEATGSASAPSSGSGLGIALGVGGGIVGLALVAVVVVLVRSRPKGAAPAREE